MLRGTVLEYDPERGIGTIRDDESSREIRVHRSGLESAARQGLYAGDIVEYRVGRNRKGGHTAVEVVRVGWEEDGEEDAPREWNF